MIFAAVGFETTAPASADIAIRAKATHVDNLSLLCAHKLVIPAIKAVLSDPQCAIDAFLCPGYVSVIIGSDAYEPIARQYGRPCVVAGFEPGQIVEGVARIVSQLADNQAVVENAYPQAVAEQPHSRAWEMLETVFTPAKTQWRAMGEIADSGLVLNGEFGGLDAATRFGLSTEGSTEPAGCRCGDVIRGRIDPPECSLFGTTCTTGNPIGPCMVSSEVACQAWLKYGEL